MPRKKKTDPIKHCASCGKEMNRKRMNGRLEDRNVFLKRKYCDRICMAKGQEKELCHSQSYSRTKANRHIKKKCEVCQGTKGLHVHHKDGNWQNNHLSNLQTLCSSCHRRSHSPNFIGTSIQRKPCLHCMKPAMKRGLCHSHLTRYRKYGSPLMRKVKVGSEFILMDGIEKLDRRLKLEHLAE